MFTEWWKCGAAQAMVMGQIEVTVSCREFARIGPLSGLAGGQRRHLGRSMTIQQSG
jgi:hypothetical protein